MKRLFLLSLTAYLGTTMAADPNMEILEAHYGSAGRVCDATRAVEERCQGRDYCEVEATNRLCGDPARGGRKELVIAYSCGDGNRTVQVWEGDWARAYCLSPRQVRHEDVRGRPDFERCRNRRDCRPRGNQRDSVWVLEAAYGARDRYCDATAVFQNACDGRSQCTVEVGNDLCGDPIKGARKQVEIEYVCNGNHINITVPEERISTLRCP